jgi:ferredoxin
VYLARETLVKLRVDLDACVGAGQCVVTAPAVFDLDDGGKVVLLDTDINEAARDDVRNAVFACPAFAIELEES